MHALLREEWEALTRARARSWDLPVTGCPAAPVTLAGRSGPSPRPSPSPVTPPVAPPVAPVASVPGAPSHP
ncbi:hypothetical protein OHT52_07520 [Streptomyces sp. NBC_00247]|uniref:hypothetical protein n=1 Tax=Streptomyces sp. NBC_00247 TaxID=2975689 RepID=UPI002E281C1C|nr:hypothetical protein [Streptomyces sp. NBC_00247]